MSYNERYTSSFLACSELLVKANVFVKVVIGFQHALSERYRVHSGAAVLLLSY
jgi:hypothetical protein